ncbi:TetR family transcriptional regulator [Spirosoma radiotolerans]|uniref:TetR family transcriptional regulator n=2 Tax=Spirosoma radiotolerans TaxID=1379870 RepID=A0A0E4A162_9BACT|nr:TetR family transcriptional regulator [Spirosoma radiotolerans]
MKTSDTEFKDLRTVEMAGLKPRQRILKTAYALFNSYGFNNIGIDRIIAESGVSKRSFYQYFPSKTDLMGACLDFREALRFMDLEKRVALFNDDPKQEILAIFDSMYDWFAEEDFNGCAFNRGLNEFNYADSEPLRKKVDHHFKQWADFINVRLAKLTTAENSEVLLAQLLSLVTGAPIIAMISGKREVALFNKQVAEALLSEL